MVRTRLRFTPTIKVLILLMRRSTIWKPMETHEISNKRTLSSIVGNQNQFQQAPGAEIWIQTLLYWASFKLRLPFLALLMSLPYFSCLSLVPPRKRHLTFVLLKGAANVSGISSLELGLLITFPLPSKFLLETQLSYFLRNKSGCHSFTKEEVCWAIAHSFHSMAVPPTMCLS